MADVSQIVDDLRGFLLSYDQTLTEDVTALAKSYADLCLAANKRLAKCQRLLQQGLRAEAIHLSHEPPDLLDSIQALEFAERAAWIEAAKQYDLPIPPEFDATAIEFLHAAFVEDNPLKELLRSHRRMALMRAPLAKRLQVLRELVQKDDASPIWPADVDIFEAARLDQIKVEAAEAKRTQDVYTLATLNDELSAKTWATPPPKPLARDVAQTLAHLRLIQKRQSQVELVVQLHDAFAELDVDKAREVRNRWRVADDQARDRGENPLYKQVEPVFLWLDERDREDEEENRYHQAVADLDSGLEQGATRYELEDLHEALLQTGRIVPDDLFRRYRARIEEFDRRTKRKIQIIAAASVLLVVALCGVALLIHHQSSKETAARETARELEKKVNGDKLVEARGYVEVFSRSKPELLDHSAVAPVVARLVAKEAAEKERIAQFDAELQKAKDAPTSPDEPEALAKAREHAVTSKEKGQILAVVARRKAAYAEALRTADDETRPKLEDLDASLARVEGTLKLGDLDEPSKLTLRDAVVKLRGLNPDVKRSSEPVRKLFREVSARSIKIQEEINLRGKVREGLDRLDRAIMKWSSDPEAYSTALAEFVRDFPDSPKAASMRKVLAEKPAWAGALACSGLGRRWKLAPNGSDDPAEAASRVAQCETLLADAPMMPDRAAFEELREHFQAIANRTQGDDNLRKRIRALLSQHTIDNVYVNTIRKATGTFKYYSKVPIDQQTRILRAIDGYTEKKSHTESISPNDIVGVEDERAPQSLLAENMKKSLEGLGQFESWDAMMMNFLDLIAQDSKTDAVLKLDLLKNFTQIAGEGSRPLATGLEPVVKKLQSAGIAEGLLWMLPTNVDANRAREKAEKLIKEVGPMWVDVKQKTTVAHQAVADRFLAIPQPVGWLSKEGTWICRPITGSILPATAELCIVSARPQGNWEVVGSSVDRSLIIASKRGIDLVEGRIVFARPKTGLGGR